MADANPAKGNHILASIATSEVETMTKFMSDVDLADTDREMRFSGIDDGDLDDISFASFATSEVAIKPQYAVDNETLSATTTHDDHGHPSQSEIQDNNSGDEVDRSENQRRRHLYGCAEDQFKMRQWLNNHGISYNVVEALIQCGVRDLDDLVVLLTTQSTALKAFRNRISVLYFLKLRRVVEENLNYNAGDEVDGSEHQPRRSLYGCAEDQFQMRQWLNDQDISYNVVETLIQCGVRDLDDLVVLLTVQSAALNAFRNRVSVLDFLKLRRVVEENLKFDS